MRRIPTQADVAARAGVSRALVSMALSGRPEVAETTRTLILQASRDIGYRVNGPAANLARRRTSLLGVVLQDVANPFFSEVAAHIQDAAEAAGLTTLLNDGRRDAAREAQAVEVFLRLRVDGLVIVSPLQDAAALTAIGRQAPTVVVGQPVPAATVDFVHNDAAAGGRCATEHLLSLGHRDIAYLDVAAGVEEPLLLDRRAGYLAAMAAAGLSERTSVVSDIAADGDAARLVLNLARRPTALLAHNDVSAIAAMGVLAQAGIAIPGDISVVGYDNTRLAAMPQFDLTSVDQPRARTGETAFALLLERMGGREPGRTVRLEPNLIVRGSTAPISST
ncbi:LacI family DNA-binding transcriptional regulator [Pengzhenrongella sicca]|uniref:LacI family DNA-binding transcriptional regulator n=1 Tax=Pengzhenrongella sicca TaxID=2819238 RepID=A0A8A4ZGK4_9MICO|nr:LacI family DNA-binding transcriptional regulator [Pengzhenrongella sicca]QTE30083.1 LacI family DNA-binding transcriptional regulator [Pengzhenrongella sicca]